LPETVAEHVVSRFANLPTILRANVHELTQVEGVGDARARAIKDGLARVAETSILDRYA
jgi:diadenylate cyclase